MPKPTRNIYRAQRHAVRAFLRGDTAKATRWMKIVYGILSRVRGPGDLVGHRPIPRRKPPKSAPLPPTMPVMLDPKGFSPGGEPNWHLNQLRLERAGLDRLPKPAPGQDRPIKGRGGKNRAAKDHSRRNRPPTSQRRTP